MRFRESGMRFSTPVRHAEDAPVAVACDARRWFRGAALLLRSAGSTCRRGRGVRCGCHRRMGDLHAGIRYFDFCK